MSVCRLNFSKNEHVGLYGFSEKKRTDDLRTPRKCEIQYCHKGGRYMVEADTT